MGLLTLIQIPCHHVLANEIALNLKYRIALKQFLNINLGIEIIKKNYIFLFIFLTYLPMFLLKFRSGELVGCRNKFRIQRVPSRHTFNGPRYPKNKKYMKNVVAGSVKTISSGYSLDAEFNSASNELSQLKFE